MSPRNKIIVTLALLLVIGGLGAADYALQGNYTASVTDNGDEPADLPPGAVAKYVGPEVQDVIEEEGFTVDESSDLSLLGQVVTDGTELMNLAILSEGDRAGSVVWVQSGNVKQYFIALKDALLNSFSPQMRDLRDDTVQEAGEPVRNVLTFLDPALSEEKIVFVRVRERLFEFHVASGKEEEMDEVIEALTTR